MEQGSQRQLACSSIPKIGARGDGVPDERTDLKRAGIISRQWPENFFFFIMGFRDVVVVLSHEDRMPRFGPNSTGGSGDVKGLH